MVLCAVEHGETLPPPDFGEQEYIRIYSGTAESFKLIQFEGRKGVDGKEKEIAEE